jgi:3-oxoacyl-[acyl-carrier-protein] synthase-3
VLQACDDEQGVIAERLGCYADARNMLRVRGVGVAYANRDVNYGDTAWDFDGQEIFKRAVQGMSVASAEALAKCAHLPADIGLVVPHQANLRIIEFVARKAGIGMDRVFVTVDKYGNMSSATVPVALVDALEQGRVAPHSLLLMPAFGGGLTWCSHVVRWGGRTTPLATSDAALPPCDRSALEIVQGYIAKRGVRGRSSVGLAAPDFAQALVPAAPPVKLEESRSLLPSD